MTTLLLLLMLHGTFLAVLLGTAGRRHDAANTTLAALVLAATVLLLELYLGVAGIIANRPHLAGVLTPIWFLIGPLALRYVQQFLRRPRPLGVRWLVLPPFAAFAWLLPFYGLSGAEKLAARADPNRTLLLFSGFWLLTGWCAHRAWLAIRDAQRTAPERLDRGAWQAAWLRFLMGGLVFYAIFDFLLTVSMLATGRFPPAAGFVSILVLTALLYGVALLVVLPDELLRSAPWPGRRYARAALPEAIAEAQVTALRQLMRDDEPWRSEDLDLATLAAMIDLNPHQLSQLLSQHLATSFADFVNGYRVDAAKQLLRETAGTMTMLEIGLEAGFGSSATFYRAFRRRTGATPREYLATIDSDKVVPIARGKRG